MKKSTLELIKKLQSIKKYCREPDLRIKLELFILAQKLENISEACARRGLSRAFYYKWWNRFEKGQYKVTALREFTTRLHRSPNRTHGSIEGKVRALKRQGHGCRMIEGVLARENIQISRSTINRIINRRKKTTTPKKRKIKGHKKRYELPIPGMRLQLDVKYVPEFVEDRRVYNYVIVDECTRLRFAYAYPELNHHMTVDFLERAKNFFPFPIFCIQTDNGFEFTYSLNPNSRSLEHPMDQWCQENAVEHRLIPPGVKELNGKVERSHRIDEQYFYWKAPTASLKAFNKAQEKWLRKYNCERPHGSLTYQTPLEKLYERLEGLKLTKMDDELEFIRLRFLRDTPKNLKVAILGRRPRQKPRLEDLELEIRKLNVLLSA